MEHDELLHYYEQELLTIRQLLSQFAVAHPQVAAQLRLTEHVVHDPHVERLIEAFAFLNARTKAKLADDFPELTSSLLTILSPDLQTPTPAMSIAKIHFDKAKLFSKKLIAQDTVVTSKNQANEQCHFRTCYPVTIWPIEVIDSTLLTKPFVAPIMPFVSVANSALKLSLQLTNAALTLSDLAISNLRFYINAPATAAYQWYELLLQQTAGVAIVLADGSPPIALDATCIKPVGFTKAEGMLPYDKRTFLGYRLLMEFFLLPEKFLFFEMDGLEQLVANDKTNNAFTIYFYFRHLPPELPITTDTFVLGCTPIVNLYEQQAEPISLNYTKTEYLLEPVQKTAEIYAINQVVAINEEGQERTYQPYYALTANSNVSAQTYWHAIRKPAWHAGHYQQQRSDMYLVFAEHDLAMAEQRPWTIATQILCCNYHIAQQLPYDSEGPMLMLAQSDEQLLHLQCLLPFTPYYAARIGKETAWKLISQLSCNALSLTDDQHGVAALRAILNLYLLNPSASNKAIIASLVTVQTRRASLRCSDNTGNAICSGMEIKLVIDEMKFCGASLYLFGTILQHFFALYCSINSFIQLTICSNHRGELYRWPPRTGEQNLI